MNIPDPAFSVLIAAYNAEKFILRTLDSVRSQTYRNFELIVVNDGSTDRTRGVVEAYRDQNKKMELTLINQENKGMGGARNMGVKNARYPLIALLDHDDIWYPKKLERVAEVFRSRNEIDLVSHDELLIEKLDGMFFKSLRLRYEIPTSSMYEAFLFTGGSLSASAVAIKKSRLVEAGLFSERRDWNGVEDHDMWLKLAQRGCKVFFLNEVLGEYIVHENNLSRDAKFSDRIAKVLDAHFRQWPKRTLYYKYLLRKRKAASARGAVKHFIKTGDFKAARSCLARSFSLDPFSWKTVALIFFFCLRKSIALATVTRGATE